MEINQAFENFHDALIGLWENLAQADISPGDDEWDEITELLYINLVNMVIETETGHYAFYSADKESQNIINLVIETGQDVMIGTENINENNYTKNIKWENTTYNNNIEFEFREFSHPIEFENKTSLNYVIGQSPKHQLQICVPYEKVEYKINKN